MESKQKLFDRNALRRNRTRASQALPAHDFLFADTSQQILDRLNVVKHTFPRILDLGCHTGHVKKLISPKHGTECFISCDPSAAMARAAGTHSIVADEEDLPFADQSLDLILSALSLHWVNDLPRALAQILRCLRPNGLFMAAMFGGNTLSDLRQSLISADNSRSKNVFPRVSPFVEIQEFGNLVQRIGFAMPVIDVDHITVAYPNLKTLMTDIRGMGEANSVNARCKHFTPRAIIQKAAAFYPPCTDGSTEHIHAKFEVLYVMGWAPHPEQQQPLRRGTGKGKLEQVLG